jgi:hypothetical protein
MARKGKGLTQLVLQTDAERLLGLFALGAGLLVLLMVSARLELPLRFGLELLVA